MRKGLTGMAAVALALAASACGGGSEPDRAGEAALATAQFWGQEAAAGVLPEGTSVQQRGTQAVVELEIPDDAADGTKARFCVEFQYIALTPPFDVHLRVYISTLVGDEWHVAMTKPDGTCEGVS